MRVLETDGTVVTTEVVVGGMVSNNKGINLPGVAVNVPALSEKDEEDLRWGLKLGADFIALSFVRSAEDVVRVHEIMAEEGRRIPVIAKIEKPQAVEAIDGIIDAFDGIMVARGDLGVELPLEAVPIVQKDIILKARRMAKPVIVATQMLESMIENPVPTRARLRTSQRDPRRRGRGDALGRDERRRYPVITVVTMARIASTEEHSPERSPRSAPSRGRRAARSRRRAEVADSAGKVRLRFTESGTRSARRACGCGSCCLRRTRRSGAGWPCTGASSPSSWTACGTFDAMVEQVDQTTPAATWRRRGTRSLIAGTPPGVVGRPTTCGCTRRQHGRRRAAV